MPPKKAANGLASTSRASPRKPATAKGYKRADVLPENQVIDDTLNKRQWRVGALIGQGGFADVYTVSDAATRASSAAAKHVIKIEPAGNGPLFQEVKFFKDAAKKTTIASFMSKQNLKSLGMMEYIASGVFEIEYQKELRWLVIPRLGRNVQEILDEQNGRFSRDSVIRLALQLLDVLEYIHSRGYAHGDIKAGNMMTGHGKTEANQVYLIDFGLVKKFIVDDRHIVYVENPKAAHDGTLLFTSMDAHKGAAPTRRGDLQILGFNLICWMVGSLPWSDTKDPFQVRAQKSGYLADLTEFFRVAFPGPTSAHPKELFDYFREIQRYAYEQEPNYQKLRDIFQKAYKDGKFRKSDLFVPAESVDVAPAAKKPRVARSTDGASTSSTSLAAKRATKAASETRNLANGTTKSRAKLVVGAKSSKNKVDLDLSDDEDMADVLKKLPPGQRRKLKAQLDSVKDESDDSDDESSDEDPPNKTTKAKKAVGNGDDDVDLARLPPGKRFKAKAALRDAVETDDVPTTSTTRARPKRSGASGKNYVEEQSGEKKPAAKRTKKSEL